MQTRLSAQDLLRGAPLQRLGREVFVLDEVDSTNAFLKARVGCALDGAIAVAEFQTAGRGRLGRRWHAPAGSSILLSVLLVEPADSPLLSRAAMLGAVAACEAIESATDLRPAVRWPNDVVIAERKVAGVLAESTSLPASSAGAGAQRAVILGIGINCLQTRRDFDTGLAERATSLALETGRPIDRATVACALVGGLDAQLVAAAQSVEGWRRLAAAWRARCADRGATATLEQDGRPFSGTIAEITEDGDLIVELASGGRKRFGAATTTRCW